MAELPDGLRAAAEAYDGNPVRARDAATTVVVRDRALPDGDTELEVYLLRRRPTMAFAPGAFVFPGGAVEASDPDVVSWAGPAPDRWATVWSCDVSTAAGLVVAAVRETFEESGVLLAGPDAGSVVADTDDPELVAVRPRLDAGELAFEDFLRAHGLVLRTDLLGPWSHWITPEFEPRRFDTRFFVAVLPEGQTVGALPGEADRAAWTPVSTAIAAVDAGEMTMLPPTVGTCRELGGLRAEDVLPAAWRRRIHPILPRLVGTPDGIGLTPEPAGGDAS